MAIHDKRIPEEVFGKVSGNVTINIFGHLTLAGLQILCNVSHRPEGESRGAAGATG